MIEDNNPSAPAAASGSWWTWVAWLERGNSGGFVYGCAARSLRSPGWSDDRSVALPDGANLLISQRLVPQDTLDRFRASMDAGTLSVDAFVDRPRSPPAITARRVVLQDCFGQSAARNTLYYTLPDVIALVGNADLILEPLLSQLQGDRPRCYVAATRRFKALEWRRLFRRSRSWVVAAPFMIAGLA
jgi:hypothetical protein